MNKGFGSILVILVLVSLALTLVIFKNNFFNREDNKAVENSLNTERETSIFKTALNEPELSIYFSKSNKLYKLQLDGSHPIELFSIPGNVYINYLRVLSSGDVLVGVQAENDKTYYSHHPGPFYILKSGSTKPIKIDSDWIPYETLTSTNFEKVYTSENADGEADIFSDSLDGTGPTKIGHLKKKLIEIGCELTNCPPSKHPSFFLPSLDGSYLLSDYTGPSGGLGASAILVSRDGSRTYDVDFYWFLSSATWLDDNKILLSDQDGIRIVILDRNGTFSKYTPSFADYVRDDSIYILQDRLSFSNEFLVIETKSKLYLYDIRNDTTSVIEDFNIEETKKSLNVQANERLEFNYSFHSWNKNSDKILFSVNGHVYNKDDYTTRDSWINLKIFNLKTGKIGNLSNGEEGLVSIW